MLTDSDVANLIQIECRKLGGMREFAAALGVSQGYVSMMANGTKSPGIRILQYFGLKKRTVYMKEGEERPAGPKTPGQCAYEEDVSNWPRYDDGSPRKSWDELDEISRLSWEKNPTPRQRPGNIKAPQAHPEYVE